MVLISNLSWSVRVSLGHRYTNIQLINTIGVADEDKRECLECWCKDNKDHGSFFCCKNCPAKEGPAVSYHLSYSVTYRYGCLITSHSGTSGA